MATELVFNEVIQPQLNNIHFEPDFEIIELADYFTKKFNTYTITPNGRKVSIHPDKSCLLRIPHGLVFSLSDKVSLPKKNNRY